MISRDDLPDTPDWDIAHVIHVTQAEYDWIMSDDDNHPWTIQSREGLQRLMRDTMPPTIHLGEN